MSKLFRQLEESPNNIILWSTDPFLKSLLNSSYIHIAHEIISSKVVGRCYLPIYVYGIYILLFVSLLSNFWLIHFSTYACFINHI